MTLCNRRKKGPRCTDKTGDLLRFYMLSRCRVDHEMEVIYTIYLINSDYTH